MNGGVTSFGDEPGTEPLIRNCTFAFRCRQQWQRLQQTDNPRIRRCTDCQRRVVLCKQDDELRAALMQNDCVAIPARLLSSGTRPDVEGGLFVGEPSPPAFLEVRREAGAEPGASGGGPTIVVDPEDGGTQAGELLPPPPGFKPTPIHDRIGEPIDPEGSCRVLNGRPYILFANWDYAEDWSGEFIHEVHPFTLILAPRIGTEEFWPLVRQWQESRK